MWERENDWYLIIITANHKKVGLQNRTSKTTIKCAKEVYIYKI